MNDYQHNKKTAIFGGSFDPVHLGHIKLAEQILNKGLVDQLIMILAARPPHKTHKVITDDQHRVHMLSLATKDIEHLYISDIELKRQGLSYTIDTALAVKGLIQNEIYICIGMDSLIDLRKWYQYDRLVKEFSFIIFKRPGYPAPELSDLEKYYNEEDAKKLLASIIEIDEIDISSTEIRQALANREHTNGLNEQVYDYILKENLYLEENEWKVRN